MTNVFGLLQHQFQRQPIVMFISFFFSFLLLGNSIVWQHQVVLLPIDLLWNQCISCGNSKCRLLYLLSICFLWVVIALFDFILKWITRSPSLALAIASLLTYLRWRHVRERDLLEEKGGELVYGGIIGAGIHCGKYLSNLI